MEYKLIKSLASTILGCIWTFVYSKTKKEEHLIIANAWVMIGWLL